MPRKKAEETEVVGIRLTREQKQLVYNAAKANGATLAGWIRQCAVRVSASAENAAA